MEKDIAARLHTSAFLDSSEGIARPHRDSDSEISVEYNSSNDDMAMMVYNDQFDGKCVSCAKLLEQFLRKQLSKPMSWRPQKRHVLRLDDRKYLSRIVERFVKRGKLTDLISRDEAGPLQLILLSLVAWASPNSSDIEEGLEEIKVRQCEPLLYSLLVLSYTRLLPSVVA